MIKRKSKPRREQRLPLTADSARAVQGDIEPIEEQPDQPEERSPDGAQRLGPAEDRGAAQTDFERADEHKAGSIETAL